MNTVAVTFSVAAAAITLWSDWKRFAPSFVAVVPFSIYLFHQYGTAMPFLVMVLAIISAKYLYSRSFFFFAPFIFAISTALLYLSVSSAYWAMYDFSIGIGTAFALFTDRQSLQHISANDNSKGVNKSKEIRRDFVQIAGGVLILLILYLWGEHNFIVMLSLAIIPLYMFGNYFSLLPESRIGKTLSAFERPTTPLGLGAIWFAAGILIAIGIVNSIAILSIIVFVTTIGDPAATIMGSTVHSPKMPYNRKKSVAGFLGIFLVSGIFGFFILGFAGLGLGLVSAFVESMSFHPLDDNFILPVILGAVSFII